MTSDIVKEIWWSKTEHLVLVTKVDDSLFYYEYYQDEYLMLERSPFDFGMEFIGEL